ncbi:DUF4079 family protein [Pseudodesulfovibrio sp.]|uniref:DUF4079 family protein n=1 Tax=unclassified Pseudodesulfovibrio TaxID=2661612 RepID=UPI003B00F95B
MLWFHPVLMTLTVLVMIYAAYLGVERFLSRHLGMRTQFLWKRHVLWGNAAIGLMLLGFFGGLGTARLAWGINFITGDHYEMALSMMPLLAAGWLSGNYMDRRKAARTVLPLLHGACNLLLLALALYQFTTGWDVIRNFVL